MSWPVACSHADDWLKCPECRQAFFAAVTPLDEDDEPKANSVPSSFALSSLEITAPPTEHEVLQLRRQAYCQAHAFWLQTRCVDAEQWGYTLGPNPPGVVKMQQDARRYAREIADIVVSSLLREYAGRK